MPALITDLFRRGAAAFSTTLAADKSFGAASASLSSATGVPTTTAIDITVGRIDSNGLKTPALKAVYKGILSGTTLSSLTLIEGTDQLHKAGTPVEITYTAATHNDIITGILTQHLQDGTHGAVTATSVSAPTGTFATSLTEAGSTLQTLRSELGYDFVSSGCVWTGDSYGTTRNASMTSGIVYIGGKRVSVVLVTARLFAASSDTYIDVDNTATITYTAVANNAVSPALAANSVRLGIIVTGATNIAAATSVNQGQESMILPIAAGIAYSVTDSLGNLICPRDPTRKLLGFRQVIANQNTTTIAQIPGLSVPVIVPTGRKVKVIFHCGVVTNSGSNVNSATLWDGVVNSGTQIVQGNSFNNSTGNLDLDFYIVVTPTTASKTYNAGGSTPAGTTTWNASATNPMFISVELA